MTIQRSFSFLLIYNGVEYVVKVFDGIINPNQCYILSPVKESICVNPIRISGSEIKQENLTLTH